MLEREVGERETIKEEEKERRKCFVKRRDSVCVCY